MATNNTNLLVKAILDTSSINKQSLQKTQDFLNKNPVSLSMSLNEKKLNTQINNLRFTLGGIAFDLGAKNLGKLA